MILATSHLVTLFQGLNVQSQYQETIDFDAAKLIYFAYHNLLGISLKVQFQIFKTLSLDASMIVFIASALSTFSQGLKLEFFVGQSTIQFDTAEER